MGAIKSIYNLLVSIQIIELLVFLYFFFESGLSVSIPIVFEITDEINFDFVIDFSIGGLIIFVVGISALFIISGLNVAASGINETSTKSIQTIAKFLAIATLLSFPTYYIFGLSVYLVEYATLFVFMSFLIHMLYFLTDKGDSE